MKNMNKRVFIFGVLVLLAFFGATGLAFANGEILQLVLPQESIRSKTIKRVDPWVPIEKPQFIIIRVELLESTSVHNRGER